MLSTFPSPTIVLVIPETVPVNVGEASGAFNAKAETNPDNCVKSAGFNSPAFVLSARGNVASAPVSLVTIPFVGLGVYAKLVEPLPPLLPEETL